MPKKRVGVTLRKPSPAPEAAAAAKPSRVTGSSIPSSVPAPAAAVAQVLVDADLGARKAPADRASVEAFVAGDGAELPARPLPAARLEQLLQRGPDGYRELTLYLPEKLAQELSLYCLERNLDMSRLVATAVEAQLRGRVASASLAEGRAYEVLGQAARALLGDLSVWARALWANRKSWPLRGSAAAG